MVFPIISQNTKEHRLFTSNKNCRLEPKVSINEGNNSMNIYIQCKFLYFKQPNNYVGTSFVILFACLQLMDTDLQMLHLCLGNSKNSITFSKLYQQI